MTCKAIAFKCGYVEDNYISWVVFTPTREVGTKKEALLSLTEYLYAKYKDRSEAFNVNDWHDMIRAYHGDTNDSNGYFEDYTTPYNWAEYGFSFHIPADQMVIIEENAEHIFSYALAELHPDMKDSILEESGEYINKDYLKLCNEEVDDE